ncbi:hypothetical protein [Methylobacterium oryzisoli]|uniref:hypothetical protein n=1 Tax=Methylobacterium oryzisoli TaxID=3385502 RepID=UPI003891CBEE
MDYTADDLIGSGGPGAASMDPAPEPVQAGVEPIEPRGPGAASTDPVPEPVQAGDEPVEIEWPDAGTYPIPNPDQVADAAMSDLAASGHNQSPLDSAINLVLRYATAKQRASEELDEISLLSTAGIYPIVCDAESDPRTLEELEKRANINKPRKRQKTADRVLTAILLAAKYDMSTSTKSDWAYKLRAAWVRKVPGNAQAFRDFITDPEDVLGKGEELVGLRKAKAVLSLVPATDEEKAAAAKRTNKKDDSYQGALRRAREAPLGVVPVKSPPPNLTSGQILLVGDYADGKITLLPIFTQEVGEIQSVALRKHSPKK